MLKSDGQQLKGLPANLLTVSAPPAYNDIAAFLMINSSSSETSLDRRFTENEGCALPFAYREETDMINQFVFPQNNSSELTICCLTKASGFSVISIEVRL